MEHVDFSLTSLLIVTVLSFLVPIFISKIKKVTIPVVVGEILVGMVIGTSGLNIVVMDEWLNFIMFFGLAYLMFASGLEIDFEVLLSSSKKNESNEKRNWKSYIENPVIFSSIVLLLTLILAYLVSTVLYKMELVKDPLLMALIIGTTSLGVVVPILKEKGISNSSFGQYIITGAVMADFVTMLLISVAVSLFKGGLSLEVLLVIGLLALVFMLYRLSRRVKNKKIFEELANGTTQIGIRGSFALMLIFLVLAESIGVEMILGSFLAGVVVSLISQTKREEIYHKLDAIGFGFLIPMFFILVGVSFDLHVLFENPKALLFVPVLLIIIYLTKGIPALLLKLFFPWKETFAGSILLTTQMSVTIAAAAIGLEVGAITLEVHAAIVLVAILTSVFSPILFGKLIPAKQENTEEQHVVIIGTTKNAILLAKRLLKHGIRVLVIESERQKAEDFIKSGIEIAWGNAMDINLLEEIEVDKARTIIVATGSDEQNLRIAQMLSNEYSSQSIITLLTDPNLTEEAHKYENIRIVNPNLSTVSLLDNMIRHPLAADILEDKKDIHMEEIEVKNCSVIGEKLRNLRIPGDILIFSVYRDGETIVPHGDTSFEKGDILLVLGTETGVEHFRKYLFR